MNDQQPIQVIITPRWRGPGQYVFVADQETGNITRVVYADDSFLRCGPRD